jgi:hypothetical protein
LQAEAIGAPSGDGAEERETDTLIPVSWSAGTGLGVVDDDNEVELNLLRDDRTGARDNVLRLEPWVNQVSAHSSGIPLVDLAQSFMF